MKITEIINEERLGAGTRSAVPNINSFPQLDNSNPYELYRFGVALAGSPDFPTPKEGPTSSNLVTIGYSDADQEIIDRAASQFGLNQKHISGKKSKEVEGTGKTSPVAKVKRNQYGV